MKRKINLSIVCLAILSIITTAALMILGINTLYTRHFENDLELVASFMYRYDKIYSIAEVKVDTGNKNFRVTVLDDKGNVLVDNMEEPSDMGNLSDRPEIVQAMEIGRGSSVRRSEARQKNIYTYAMKMEDGNILCVSRDADNVFRFVETILPSMILMFIILCIISMTIAQLLTKKLLKPIEELTENMEGDLQEPCYKELEPFLRKIREQHAGLIKSSKMRQEFTANVTHELKTPLTSISGYAELIETGMASGEDTIRFSEGIHKNANRLLTLINDIIRLSELDSLEEELRTEPLNLYCLAAACVDTLKLNAKIHNVNITLKGEKCRVKCNRMMMEELLFNLCDNAIRYNNENGSVLVEVFREEKKVVLRVSDTGIGIPREHQERIFERFYRVDKSRSKSTGGTGLGLAIVKHIVDLHGAQLNLQSEAGKGTVMSIIFEEYKS